MVRDPRDVLVDVGDPHKVKIGDMLVLIVIVSNPLPNSGSR